MKRYAALVLALIMALICVPALAEKADREVEGNLVLFTTAEDFMHGSFENTEINEAIGNGAVALKDGAAEGSFTSDIIGTAPFEYLVASWNTDTPSGTWIEVSARVYVDMKKAWSDWLSWGKWSGSINRASVDGENDLAYMDTDTFTVSGKDGETASRVQLKVTLHANEDGVSPTLRQVALTYKNTLDGQHITPLYNGETLELPEKVKLDTPAYSQMVRERGIANVMCSATTICVLLNDRGEDALPEEIALIDYDKYYEGFGNWSYSVAAAGSYGYDAYVQYADLDILRQELAHGYSVGISVAYSSSSNGQYPYLENGAANNTAGHLITITGYETIDGVDYFYSSDSAASADDQCVRRYKADQLDAAWRSGIAYIVHDKEENVSACNPNRIAAELKPVEGGENEYALVVNGEEVKLPKSFTAAKLKGEGNGIIAYYLEGEEADARPVPEGAKLTTANNVFRYGLRVSDNGYLIIKPDDILSQMKSATMNLFVMVNDGTTYAASMQLEAAAAEPEATAAPEATLEPESTEAPIESNEPVSAENDANGARLSNGAIIAIAAAIVAVIAIILVVLKKKKH